MNNILMEDFDGTDKSFIPKYKSGAQPVWHTMAEELASSFLESLKAPGVKKTTPDYSQYTDNENSFCSINLLRFLENNPLLYKDLCENWFYLTTLGINDTLVKINGDSSDYKKISWDSFEYLPNDYYLQSIDNIEKNFYQQSSNDYTFSYRPVNSNLNFDGLSVMFANMFNQVEELESNFAHYTVITDGYWKDKQYCPRFSEPLESNMAFWGDDNYITSRGQNCTWYAWGRFNELYGLSVARQLNKGYAGDWVDINKSNDVFEVLKPPEKGDYKGKLRFKSEDENISIDKVIQRIKNNLLGSVIEFKRTGKGWGHVAIVEQIIENSNNSLTFKLSASNFKGPSFEIQPAYFYLDNDGYLSLASWKGFYLGGFIRRKGKGDEN